MKMYIILEYLLIENFIINFLILYLTKVLTRKDASNRRVILGAFIATLYSLCYFYPWLLIFTKFPFKLIVSIIIIRISFKYINKKLFFRELMGFYIISFVFAGASIGMYFSSNDYTKLYNKSLSFIYNFPVTYLLLGIILSGLAILIVFKFYKHKLIQDNFIAHLKIVYKTSEINLKGLIDTGNSLIDPFSKNKVIIVEYDALKSILPYDVSKILNTYDSNNFIEFEQNIEAIKDEIKLYFIPYKSIGKSGIIVGFKPDYVEINYNNRTHQRKDILIGIYSGNLTKDMGYSCLLHNELLNEGVENNGDIQTENILL